MRFLALAVSTALVLTGCGVQEARDRALAEAAVKPLSQPNSWVPGLVALPDYLSSGLGPAGYPGVDIEAGNPNGELDPVQEFLDSIGIRSEDLNGTGIVDVINKGDTLAAPTLDFCGKEFASENRRLARRQVAAFNLDGTYGGVSTEAVQYESIAAAQKAIDEMVAAKAACPDGTTYVGNDGVEYTVTFHPASGPDNTVLVDAGQRAILHMVTTSAETAQRSLIALQVRGNTLLGIYVSETGDTPFDQDVLDSIFGLISRISERLMNADPVMVGILD